MSKNEKKTSKQSKGLMNSVNPKICDAVRKERSFLDNLLKIQKAWKLKLNPWILIPNPDPLNTKERSIWIRTNLYWGLPERPKLKKEAEVSI